MPAHESFEKRGKIVVTKGYLRPTGEVEEFAVVNSVVHPFLPAAPLPTDVGGQSEPAGKVVGDAGTGAPRIRFHAAAHREHSSWEQAVHIGAGIDKGVSAEKFPFGGRLILRCRERANAAQDGNYRQPHNCNTATRVMRVR